VIAVLTVCPLFRPRPCRLTWHLVL
jgi:hypothetical protein